jgi:hypothetical protein
VDLGAPEACVSGYHNNILVARILPLLPKFRLTEKLEARMKQMISKKHAVAIAMMALAIGSLHAEDAQTGKSKALEEGRCRLVVRRRSAASKWYRR